MRNLWLKFLMEKADDGQGGGGGKSEDKSAAPPNDPASEGEGNQLDDFGYEIPKEEGDKKPDGKEGKKPEVPKEDSSKVEDPASGYGDEPEKVDPPAKADPPKEEKIDLGFEVNAEGLEAKDAEKLKSFAKKHGLSKEQAQALLDDRKAETQSMKQAREQAERQAEEERKQIRSQWHKELKDDPNFGGEKFSFNVARVEKVIEEFMPNTKKILTERRTMLPPYVMRDLKTMSDTLFGTERLVQGDPTVPSEKSEDKNPHAFLDEMYS